MVHISGVAAMGQDVVIRLEGISFSYPGREVLKGLSLQVRRGERVGITGPNGSGKTTLLHIIVGLLGPQVGTVEVFGRIPKGEEDFQQVRRKVGLLFQDPDDQLFCPTVIEDVAFGPLNLGIKGPRAKALAREILQRMGLGELEDRPIHTLSGGEKRLVSLASVLAMGPEILLLDEPTSGLDEETRERVLRILDESAETYILVSHDHEILQRATTSLYRLNSGRLHPLR